MVPVPGSRALRLIALAVLIAAGAPSMASAQLSVEGTEFILRTQDGRTLRSPDLVGATLMIGSGDGQIAVTIESVEEDPDATGGRVLLHRFVVKSESGERSDLCTPDAAGKNLGFPLPDGKGGFELTCTSGAIGKCVRWGYRFWEEEPGGPPIRALHQACTRMARADYGGDGGANTRDGTLISYCDRFGINPCEGDSESAMTFEAAWGTEGAVCVAHPRIAEVATLEALAEKYPRLAPHLGASKCTLEAAMKNPDAILFNRSKE